MAAGFAAGECAASQDTGSDYSKVGLAAAVAAKTAGGAVHEQQSAAGAAIANSIKANGGSYSKQAQALASQMGTSDRNTFLSASRPKPGSDIPLQLVNDDGIIRGIDSEAQLETVRKIMV